MNVRKLSVMFFGFLLSSSVYAETFAEMDKSSFLINQPTPVTTAYQDRPEYFTNEKVVRSSKDIIEEKKVINKASKEKDSWIKYYGSEYNDVISEMYISALRFNYVKLAEHLRLNMEANIDLNYLNEKDMTTALISLASSKEIKGGNIEYFMFLTSRGVPISDSNFPENISLLNRAIISNNYKIVLYLILSGEDYLKKDFYGKLPLDYAMENNAVESAFIVSSILSKKIK